MTIRETRRILLDGNVVDVVVDGDLLTGGAREHDAADDEADGEAHPESAHAETELVRLLAEADKRGALRLVASKDGAAGSVTIHADARIYAGLFDGTEAAVLPIDPARKAYVFVARGSVAVNDQALDTGDAALLSAESRITVSEGQQAEVLVFDLAP